ncbi:MAG TPA: mandelate racemase/muconate lactonizing enzyme family protein [Pseudolysinimonas sp.]|jgi:2-dehydro-3-deoxyphosphogalactonate aldolase
MKISGIEMFPVANPRPHLGGPNWLFLRLDTDEGISGYGEILIQAVPARPWTIAHIVEELVEDLLLGHEVGDVEHLYWRLYNIEYSHMSDPLKSAITSGLEMACFDALGKAHGLPAYRFLGGKMRDRIRSYTYIGPPPEIEAEGLAKFWERPEAVAERALGYVEAGFTGLKLDPVAALMDDDTHMGQRVPVQLSLDALDLAEKMMSTLRDAVGHRCDILIGTHGQMTPSSAIRLAKRLEPYEPLWFEEPVPPEMPEAMAEVARGTTIPIVAGERLTSKWECARLVNAGAVAALNVDASQVGGMLEVKKIAAIAEANYVQITPHIYGGPFVGAASVQLGASLTNFLIMEAIEGYRGVHAELLDEPIEWDNGDLIVSDRPGLGHNLNEDLARRLAPGAEHTRIVR